MKKKIVTISLITIFSIFLWGSVSLSGDYFTTESLPLTYELNSAQRAIGIVSDTKVTVSIKGQGWQLTQLTFGRNQELKIEVNDKEGKQKISIRNILEKTGIISSNLQIVEIKPEAIEVLVEKKKEKKVPIKSVLDVEFKDGFGLVSDVKLYPDSVKIIGAESLLAEMTEINTLPIEFSSLDRDVSTIARLSKTEFVDFSLNTIQVSFDVQKIVDKEFDNIIIESRNIPLSRELILFPPRISISLRGGINQLGQLKEDEIKAFITYRQAVDDTIGSLQPIIEVPDGIQVINKKPNRLQYIIKQL